MSEAPSIKGSVFESSVEEVNKYRADGTLSDRDMERWLRPDDLEYLAALIVSSAWYPIASYDRLNQLLLEAVHAGDPQGLREAGRQTARRLIDSQGFYAQLEYLQHTEVERVTDSHERFEAFGRDLQLLATLQQSILNFSKYTPRPDPKHPQRWIIDVTEAANYPDVLCWRADGLINEMAQEHGENDLWTWRRIAPDRIHWTMTRDL